MALIIYRGGRRDLDGQKKMFFFVSCENNKKGFGVPFGSVWGGLGHREKDLLQFSPGFIVKE